MYGVEFDGPESFSDLCVRVCVRERACVCLCVSERTPLEIKDLGVYDDTRE